MHTPRLTTAFYLYFGGFESIIKEPSNTQIWGSGVNGNTTVVGTQEIGVRIPSAP